jgi:hypothetical protein
MCIYDSTAAFNSENYSELVEREISDFMRGWSNEEKKFTARIHNVKVRKKFSFLLYCNSVI